MATKKDTLSSVLADLRKKDEYQIGSLSNFDMRVEGITTGNLTIDALTGVNGLPKGRVVELYGMPSSGKTTTALQCAANLQQEPGCHHTGFWDHETSLDEKYVRALGIDPDAKCEECSEPFFLYEQPRSFEHGANLFFRLLPWMDLLITDSVAAMTSEHELGAEVGKVDVGTRGRLMYQYMRKAIRPIAQRGTCMVFLNHIQDVIDTSPIGRRMLAQGIKRQITPGGRGLKFYACLAPGTTVLRSDMRWVPIETLAINDKIVAFDEHPEPGQAQRRKLREATVVQNELTVLPSFRVVTDKGTETVASANHKWLVRKYPSATTMVWKETSELAPGDEIGWFSEPWELSNSYEAAYLSGIYDGEGHISRVNIGKSDRWLTTRIGVCQNVGIVYEKIKACLETLGYRYQDDADDSNPRRTKPHRRITLTGSVADRMRFMGEVRPVRLMEKFGSAAWEGSSAVTNLRGEGAKFGVVKEIEFVGDREVYAIGTSTGTLFADGMFSHNSLRMEFKQIGNVKSEIWDPIKNEAVQQPRQTKTLVTVVKNKVGDPFGTAEVRVRFGRGFSNEWSALDVLVRHGLVKKETGGVYRFADVNLCPLDESMVDGVKAGMPWIKGEDNVVHRLEQDREWAGKCISAARDLVSVGWDVKLDEDAQKAISDDSEDDEPSAVDGELGADAPDSAELDAALG